VVAVPAVDSEFAYISCGTWALAGVELTTPLITEAGRQANFTNELGVDGTVRYLRNVMGLWILQETLRTWRSVGDAPDLDGLLAAAAELPAGGPMFDVDDPDLLPPGEMVSRVRRACERAGVPVPQGPVAVVRCILDSLAVAMADAVHRAAELTGVRPRVIHLVGGGSRNTLLCRLLADAAGLPVEAGPAEATAIGNVLVQARAAGTLEGDLFRLRSLVRRTQAVVRYEPRGDPP
jgi:rhamnulokinase